MKYFFHHIVSPIDAYKAKSQKIKLMSLLKDDNLPELRSHLEVAAKNPEFLSLMRQAPSEKLTNDEKNKQLPHCRSNEAFDILYDKKYNIEIPPGFEAFMALELIKNECLRSYRQCIKKGFNVNDKVNFESQNEFKDYFSALMGTYSKHRVIKKGGAVRIEKFTKLDGYELTDCLKNLIDHGYDTQLRISNHTGLLTPLSLILYKSIVGNIGTADSLALIDLLLNAGADVNRCAYRSKKFFYLALGQKNEKVVDFLMNYYEKDVVQLEKFKQEVTELLINMPNISHMFIGLDHNDRQYCEAYREKLDVAIEAAKLRASVNVFSHPKRATDNHRHELNTQHTDHAQRRTHKI